MKKELQNKLYKKYPKIFAQKNLGPRETLMCFGFECGDGWYWLIDGLCSSLQWHTDKNSYPQVEAIQVKEKFGGLRFYTNNIDDYLSGYIAFAETLSYKICDKCGTTNNITTTKGWIRTICKECLAEVDKTKDDKTKEEDFAHEIWAVSQLVPDEGIEDGVKRIIELIKEYHIIFKGNENESS